MDPCALDRHGFRHHGDRAHIHLGEIGLVNLGYAGLFAVGAYAATLLEQAGLPFIVATLLAMALAWLTGGFLGFCSVRTSGDYFALVTLGFGRLIGNMADFRVILFGVISLGLTLFGLRDALRRAT